jgi:hypothetical protein
LDMAEAKRPKRSSGMIDTTSSLSSSRHHFLAYTHTHTHTHAHTQKGKRERRTHRRRRKEIE